MSITGIIPLVISLGEYEIYGFIDYITQGVLYK